MAAKATVAAAQQKLHSVASIKPMCLTKESEMEVETLASSFRSSFELHSGLLKPHEIRSVYVNEEKREFGRKSN